MLSRNKAQKINMRVTTFRYETSGKNNAHLLSHDLPTGEKINWNKQHFGTRQKSCIAYRRAFYTLHIPGSNWNSTPLIDSLNIIYNVVS